MSALPESSTNFWVNCIGCVWLFGLLYLFVCIWPDTETLTVAYWMLAGVFLPIVIHDVVKRRVWRSSSVDFGPWRKPDKARIATKLLGIAGIYAAIAGLYWLFPEYHRDFFQHYWQAIRGVAPLLLMGVVPYIYCVDGYMRQPLDAYFYTGRLLMGDVRGVDVRVVGANFRSWIIKAFFLPLMLEYFIGNIVFFRHFHWESAVTRFTLYEIAYNFLFLIDVVYATLGYVATFKPLNSHIRSTDSTMAGWAVTLICYEPFNNLMVKSYLNHDSPYAWGVWLGNSPVLYCLWGGVICLLLVGYALSCVSFGYRFSNLTYRGLISNGPYHFTKHPAYVTKNLTWWLISIPFIIGDNPMENIHRCVALLALNLIYYLRAVTEERHLSQYPEYIAYALAMNEQSIFSRLGRMLPFLRYKAPQLGDSSRLA